MPVGVIIVIVILVLVLIMTLAKSITIIHQAEKGLIERFGRYKETLEPGLRFIVPFIDSLVSRIDMRGGGLQFHHLLYQFVKKIAVVRDCENGSVVSLQVILQPFCGFDVQVIGGLI